MIDYKVTVNEIDISQIVDTIYWSGDIREALRQLKFNIVNKKSDYYLPKIKIKHGDKVEFFVQENLLFYGIIVDIDVNGQSDTISISAFDLMFYIKNNEISKICDGLPEVISRKICADLGVEVGEIAATGVKIYLPLLQKSAYEIISECYNKVSEVNNKKYIIRVIKNKFNVFESGLDSGVMLGATNIINTNYKVSITEMVNKVVIVDETGKVKNTLTNDSDFKFGVLQKISTDTDLKSAKTLLNSVEETASVNALSDIRAISGMNLVIEEGDLKGKFLIVSDTHEFSVSQNVMNLTLEYVR